MKLLKFRHLMMQFKKLFFCIRDSSDILFYFS